MGFIRVEYTETATLEVKSKTSTMDFFLSLEGYRFGFAANISKLEEELRGYFQNKNLLT